MLQAVNYTMLATIVLVLSIWGILAFGLIIYLVCLIRQVREDMIKEDEAIYRTVASVRDEAFHDIKSRKNRLDTHYIDICRIDKDLFNVKGFLYRPLYNVGDTIYYNRAEKGKNGAFIDFDGVIKEIVINPNAEPDYIVDGHEGKGVYVSQGMITAWSN